MSLGGSGFSSMVERSTNYDQFEVIFNSVLGYESRNDRAIMISVAQHLWDSTDPETYLPFINDGEVNMNNTEDVFLGANTILTIHSANDAQVPMLSSDRASRTAEIPVLSNSTRLPYGREILDGPIIGSALVYFDGDFPEVPDLGIPKINIGLMFFDLIFLLLFSKNNFLFIIFGITFNQ